MDNDPENVGDTLVVCAVLLAFLAAWAYLGDIAVVSREALNDSSPQ